MLQIFPLNMSVIEEQKMTYADFEVFEVSPGLKMSDFAQRVQSTTTVTTRASNVISQKSAPRDDAKDRAGLYDLVF